MQLSLFEDKQVIETVVVEIKKEIPLEFFKHLHRFSVFAEEMERDENNNVIWNEETTCMYDEGLAEVEYLGIQNEFFKVTMEIPKEYTE